MQQSEGYSLTSRDRRRLAAAMRQASDARHFRRLQAVWLVTDGLRTSDVAALLGASQRWVNKWLSRYRDRHRCEDLAERKHSGRPPLGSAISPALLLSLLEQSPLEFGYGASVWTVPLLKAHLHQHHACTWSDHTLRRRLHAAGFRWKRPRYVFSQKDPNRAQKKGASSAE